MYISNKIKKGIFALNQVKNILSTETLKMLYFSLIHSHLIYCLEVWGNSSSVNKIFKLQKKAVRIIYKQSYRSHTEPLFKLSGILKVKDLYESKLLLFAYDYKNNVLPKSFINFFPNRNLSRITRQSNNINITIPRTCFSAQSVTHKIVSTWNELSNELKTFKYRRSFKRNIKINILNIYSDHITCSNAGCQQCFP